MMKVAFLASTHSSELLAQHFETLIVRLESGQTLRQALKDAPPLQASRVWAERWIKLRSRLLEGQSSALEGLQSFHRALSTDIRLRRLIRKKASLPLFQALMVVLSSLGFVIFTQSFADDVFKLNALDWALQVFLFSSGGLWIGYLLQRVLKDLWFLEWIEFLSALETQMSWGQNFLSVWKQNMRHTHSLPTPLRTLLNESLQRAQNYESLCASVGPKVSRPKFSIVHKLCPLQQRASSRWMQIHELFVLNDPVLKIIQSEIESALSSFENHLETQCEKLSGRLLLPLFVCFLPASLYVSLKPLLSIAKGF